MNILFSLKATESASTAVLSFQKVRRFTSGTHLKESVRILCRALRHLEQHVRPAKLVVVKPTPSLVEEPREVIRSDHPMATQEINGCKALLLEIIRRASYDWVLYRMSSRLQQKKLAEDSFHWLFVEEPGTSRWTERTNSQKAITSFLSICDALDLDPEMVRHHIRKLTIKNVMSVGRPAEYRRNDWQGEEHVLTPGTNVDFDAHDTFEEFQNTESFEG